MSLRIKSNDKVVVLSGRDKGKEGKVIKVFPDKEKRPDKWKLIVEGINRVKRHTKPTSANRQGGIIEKELPLWLCKVQLLCPNCVKAVRFLVSIKENGQKVRVCKSCQEPIDKID
ncbi:50S ribosomal protein L24 [bacterium]|nr:50S ribosomal protein L24 [bacterium]